MDSIYAFVRLPVVQVAAVILGLIGLWLELRTVLRLRGRKLEGGKLPMDLLAPFYLGSLLFGGGVVILALAYA